MNVLRWCPFVHLFDIPFQNSPYGHVIDINGEHNFLTDPVFPYVICECNKADFNIRSSITVNQRKKLYHFKKSSVT